MTRRLKTRRGDLIGAELRRVPRGELVVQLGAGHFPWVDDPGRFVELVVPFLCA